MSHIDELYKITVELHKVVQQDVTNQNREEIISKVNDLINKREHIIPFVKPPFSESENNLGQDVINLNKEIEARLEQLFSQLKREMKQMQQQKKSNRSYINPYGPIKTIDGMYVDSKQ